MRKIYSSLLMIAFVAVTVLTTGCKKDDPAAPAPEITLTTTVASTYTYEVGTSFDLSVRVFAPEKIKIVKVERIVDGLPVKTLDGYPKKSGFTEKNTIHEATLTVKIDSDLANGDKVAIRVTATDENSSGNKTLERSFSYTVGQANSGAADGSTDVGAGGTPPTLTSSVTVILGDQGATEGSYYISSSNTVLLTGELSASNAGNVDVTLAQTTGGTVGTGKLVFVSPALRASSSDAAILGTDFNFGTGNTFASSATDTYFAAASGLSSTDITAITDSEIDELGITTSNQYISLAANSMYTFINDKGKKGVIKVTAIADSGSGKKVTFQVRVQQ